ncbi:uncharacterized protein LOC130728974 [Lotus japonicus]|uniref:uncharacterized protein LOC130728974 n=1 Tax=Lotus japonicus TaxID=34305 RepID=UPI00258FD7C9|nr:uncharacterized protein LOC130728974 [Lotus japonicus]
MFPVDEPGKAYAINLVLIDSQGVKIEACIKKNYLNHEFKIFFNLRTRVVPESSDVIPTIGLSLKNSADIEATLGESDFLIGMKTFFYPCGTFSKNSTVAKIRPICICLE